MNDEDTPLVPPTMPHDEGKSSQYAGLPPKCEVRDWVVFGPGNHKGDLYSVADCLAMGKHFAELSAGATPILVPTVKVGHDWQERSAESLGFPTLGKIGRCEIEANGLTHIWLADVPTQLGGSAINAGMFRRGSIEIPPPLEDPRDQARKLHPVLTGVALLGEEQPAVKVQYPIPPAVFADGTPVPPETDLTMWINLMASVMRAFSSSILMGSRRKRVFKFAGKVYAADIISFSDMTPLPGGSTMPDTLPTPAPGGAAPPPAAGATMNRDQILAALKEKGIPVDDPEIMAKSDQELQAMMTDFGTMSFSTFARKHFAAPVPPPGGAAGGAAPGAAGAGAPPAGGAGDMPPPGFMAEFAAFKEDITKRVGALDSKVGTDQKKNEEAQMSAAVGRVEEVLNRNRKKLPPVLLNGAIKDEGVQILTKKQFAADNDRVAAFSAWAGALDQMQDDPRFATTINDSKVGADGKRPMTPLQIHMTRPGGFLDRNSPIATKKIRESAA